MYILIDEIITKQTRLSIENSKQYISKRREEVGELRYIKNRLEYIAGS